jgi:hypothetical protein
LRLIIDEQAIDKSRAVVGQRRVDLVWHECNQGAQEVRSDTPS